MTHGKSEGQRIRHHLVTRTPLPKWVVEAPELYIGLEFTFNAFFDLSGDRHPGGPIPYSSMASYADRQGLYGEDAEDFIHHVREMDQEFLAYNQEQTDRERSRG